MSQPDDEDAWRAIVDNFGDRAELSPDELAPRPPGPNDPSDPSDPFSGDDEFVPPDPGPLRLPEPPRLLAWGGVLGAPLILFAVVAFGIGLPILVSYLVVIWFLGGFAYLVTTMPNEPNDPWDDGATL